MKVKCEIRLQYSDEDSAKAVLGSVNVDNGSFVESEIKGNIVVFRAESESPMSLSHTLNDLLACVKVAENSLL